MLPKRSKMMDALYGEKDAQVVYDRCQELSPTFNTLVQEVVYDMFWSRPGLALKDKSLVTIIALITVNKEEQLQIHLRGFFNLARSLNTISQCVAYMKTHGYISKEIHIEGLSASSSENLSIREKGIVDLMYRIAIGNAEKTNACMDLLLKNNILSAEEIENIMLHEMLYVGFPCAMNGFVELKNFNSH